MTYQPISALLRSDIKSQLGRVTLVAVQDHMYHKALDYFDPMAAWQTIDVLELSEMAHRLRDYAEKLDCLNPVKMEAVRLSKVIWNDFAEVYKVAMKRAVVTQVA